MKFNKTHSLGLIVIALLTLFNCSEAEKAYTDDSSDASFFERSAKGVYIQEDQMARPAINTVFVSSDAKNTFNVTIPSEQGAGFQNMFESNLLALNPGFTTNALGFDATGFTTALSTDVLTVSLTGTTTFFDGTNVLTGRALADDVISTELLLIFGGPDGTANPNLTDDFVDSNDKDFLMEFPYAASPW